MASLGSGGDATGVTLALRESLDCSGLSRLSVPPPAHTVVQRAPGRWTLDAWLLAETLLSPDVPIEPSPDTGRRIGALPASGHADVAAVVAAGLAAGEVHALARASRAPVLAIPDRPLAAAGPLVLDARDHRCLGAATGCLAAARAMLLTIVDPGGSELDDASYAATWHGADEAVAEARRQGLASEAVFGVRPDDLLGAARRHSGLIVAGDPGAPLEASAVSRALHDRRPVLLVPRAAWRSSARHT